MAGGRVQINDPTITPGGLPPANLPLDGTEIIIVVQGGIAMRVSSANLIGPAAVGAAGGVTMQGFWNALTNSPSLQSGLGSKGFMYTVNVAGATNLDGINVWNVGDKALFNGATWEKVDGAPNEVVQVAGLSGTISAVALKAALAYTASDIDNALGYVPLNKAGDVMSGILNMGGLGIINLPTPSNPGDATPKSYVDGIASGLHAVTAVKAASPGTNVNTASAPATLDGVSGTNGDRWLLKDQSSAAQNGVYIFNGTGSPLTRSADMNSWGGVVGALVPVASGGATNGGTVWVDTNATGGTLGTTAITFTQFSSAGAGVSSWNGRNGAVSPATGDYTIGQLATIGGATIVGNNGVGAANPLALSVGQVQTMLGCALWAGGTFTGEIQLDGTTPWTNSLWSSVAKIVKNKVVHWLKGASGNSWGIGVKSADDKWRVLTSSADDNSAAGVDQFTVDGSGNIVATGTATATSYNTSSDRTLKDNIYPATSAYWKGVLDLEPTLFNFKAQPRDKRMGFIAQDVQQAVPAAVKRGDDGMLSIDYPALVAALLGVVKDQGAQIAELDRRLSTHIGSGA